MTRTILFPVTYRISGRLHGRQQARTYLFAEAVEASITDVSPEDAPVAVSWKVPVVKDSRITPWEQSHMWAFDTERQQHTRFFDGRHWLRVLSEQRYIDAPVVPISASEFAASAHTGRFNGSLGFVVETKQRKIELVTAEPRDRFDDIDESGRWYAIPRAKGLEFISVDDVLYVRCEQPCFKLVPVEVSSGRIRHIPVVDTVWNGERRPLDKTRITPLPLSMREEVIRRCGSTDPFSAVGAGGDVEWPLVHLLDSMSTDYDLELEADYLIQEFQANYRNHAYLEFYFHNKTPEDKLDHLLRGDREWAYMGSSASPIRRAIEALEGISITLSPQQASSGPAPW
ncbi:hypothetical protein [Rhizobium sp. BK176]|uniref:hypothetical protein n=1 Tax=Rhizobium sp. BK176 TaxID=2587071 RepID=UPI0021679F6F|nr:hypothetical protein [Rhizobium sp. BK176]MCS4089635.1 hypothetical protein [Rhizobium sp. BK176]